MNCVPFNNPDKFVSSCLVLLWHAAKISEGCNEEVGVLRPPRRIEGANLTTSTYFESSTSTAFEVGRCCQVSPFDATRRSEYSDLLVASLADFGGMPEEHEAT